MLDTDKIYNDYAPMVFKYLISLCNDADTAEELSQETFYRAIKSSNRFMMVLVKFQHGFAK